MMSELPLVTVIAVCYNHARFVVECLESIRTQTYPHIQLIIMDDCSQDQSVAIITDWIEANQVQCDFIHHSVNMGFCKTLNEALRIAEGKYVSIVATDDCWLPDFFLAYVQEIESRPPQFGLVYGNSFTIDEDGIYLPAYRKRPEYHPEGDVLYELIRETFISTNAVLVKRELIEKVGFYDESLFFEDFDMWTRLAEICWFAYCPKILAKYRTVATSMVRTKRKEIIYSYLQILSRIVNAHPEAYPLIEERKVDIALDLYQLNHQKSYYYLFRNYKKNRNVRRLIQSVMAFLGISFKTSEELLTVVGKFRRG